MKIYRCKHCGNQIYFLHNSGVEPACCGEQMVEIKENTTDAAQEKHVPVYEREQNKIIVKVGSVAHPMLPEHYIQWIAIETSEGVQYKFLNAEMAPEAVFHIAENEKLLKIYAYCNLHGLWICIA